MILWADLSLGTPANQKKLCDWTDACDQVEANCGLCHERETGGGRLNDFGETLRGSFDSEEDLLQAYEEIKPEEEEEVVQTPTEQPVEVPQHSEGSSCSTSSSNQGSTTAEKPPTGNASSGSLEEQTPSNAASTASAALAYDHEVAYRKVQSIYCGKAATFSEIQKLNQAQDQKAKKAMIHDLLESCLQSDYWKNYALHRIADPIIEPRATTSTGGQVVLADYRFDYRLFAHIMSDDRDARELLTAKYHIDKNGRKVEGRIRREERAQVGKRIVIGGGQPLRESRRFGLITTQWFLVINTMFSELPRGTASQAYRSFLDCDLALGECLQPGLAEPKDVDNKGVKQEECALCHRTLDELSYAFSNYNGIETVSAFLFNSSGKYDRGKTPWEGYGSIFGTKVKDLNEWVNVAIKSDQFKKNLAKMFWKQAFSEAPSKEHKAEFEALWKSIDNDGFSANRLIHRLVDTMAFGGIRS